MEVAIQVHCQQRWQRRITMVHVIPSASILSASILYNRKTALLVAVGFLQAIARERSPASLPGLLSSHSIMKGEKRTQEVTMFLPDLRARGVASHGWFPAMFLAFPRRRSYRL